MADTLLLSCQHVSDGCSRPWGYIGQGGILEVASRHGGVKHTNTMSITELLRKALAMGLMNREELLAIHGVAGEALRNKYSD